MKEILSLSNVTFSYENETVLENISLSVKEGDFVGIIGKNGSGKSTLLKLILGLKKPNSGIIVKPDNKKIGYVEQLSLNTDSVFPATVQEIVMLGLYSKIGLFKFPGKKHKEMVVSALKMVGMQDYLKKQVTFLSGGQQQKVLIAKALVCNPDILILDEPTTGIDATSEKEFISTLTTLNKTYNKTIILVTHNFDKLVIANKVLKINNKNITEEV